MTYVMHNLASPRPQRRGLTLIEIMVVVGILVLLTTILLAVTTSVSRKAEVQRTQTILKGLDGLVKDYEAQTGQPMLLNGAAPPVAVGTVYYFGGATPVFAQPGTNLSVINLLYRLPNTRSQLEDLLKNSGGTAERLVQNYGGTANLLAVTDAWNNPIQYIRQGSQPGAGVQGFATTWLVATRSYFISAGPDGQIDFNNPGAAVNADNILSYEP